MISIFVLIVLAFLLGSHEGKNPGALDPALQVTVKWGIALTSPLWLGVGLFGMFAVFLLYQLCYSVAKNISEGASFWFIDEDSWVGALVVKYLGKDGGRILFIAEAVLILIILVL
jgi:hypothetical protein